VPVSVEDIEPSGVDLGQLVRAMTPKLAMHNLAFIHWLLTKDKGSDRGAATPLKFHEAWDDVTATAVVASEVVRLVLRSRK
jgi:hypothetical protein